MATITKTTVEVSVGSYVYRADVEGGRVELYATATTPARPPGPVPSSRSRRRSAPTPKDKLEAAIDHNLRKAYFARTETFGKEVGPHGQAVEHETKKTADAGTRTDGRRTEPARPDGRGRGRRRGPWMRPNTGEIGARRSSRTPRGRRRISEELTQLLGLPSTSGSR